MVDSEHYNVGPLEREPSPAKMQHYYGDIVRRLLIVGAIIMLLIAPYEYAHRALSIPFFSTALFAIAMVFLAGFTNPRHRWTILFDTIVSACLCLIFAYLAFSYYTLVERILDPIFLVRQLLALIFLIALYFSSKSLRGMTP